MTAEEFTSALAVGRYEGYFKFAFVRNPWDRLVSCYLQKLGPGASDNAIARRFARRGEGSFREFVDLVCKTPDERANPHFRSQHIGLLGADSELLPDFVGRFQNLAEDFARIASRIGAPHLRLPHLTPALSREPRHYRDFYDEELAEKVGERFRKDTELFRYSF